MTAGSPRRPSREAVPRYATRIALAYGQTIVRELSCSSGRVTIGHAPSCTFVLPTDPAVGKATLIDGGVLHLHAAFDGHFVLGGDEHDVADLRAAGKTTIPLRPEDWGVLWLRDRPGVRVVILRVTSETLAPMPGEGAGTPLVASTALSAVAFGIFMVVSFLRYDPERPQLEFDELDDRISRAMFNNPPREEPPPEEEATIGPEERKEEKTRKRAGGPEGTFGRPDRTARSNIPRTDAKSSSNAVDVGLVKELDILAQHDALAKLHDIGGEISGMDDGPLVVGYGSYGMSTKGTGSGGGGEGEGIIHATGAVDMGGAGSVNRKRQVKGASGPKEREISVQPGTAKVRGQLSKELIDREVRRHRAQIGFCYNKQLTRQPDLSGKVTLQWIISLDGSVKAAKVRSSSLGNADAESCMVRALQGWHFPKPEGGVVEVEYPFVFDAK